MDSFSDRKQKQLSKVPVLDDVYKDKVIQSRCRILLSWHGNKYKFAKLETAKDGSFYVYHAQFSNNSCWPFVRYGTFSYQNINGKLTSSQQTNSRDIHLSLHPKENVILIGGNIPPKKVRMPTNWYPVKKPWLVGRIQSENLLTSSPLPNEKLSNVMEIKVPDNHLGSIAGDIYIIPPFVSESDVGKQKLDYIVVMPGHKQYSIWIFFKFIKNVPPGLLIPSKPGSYGCNITKEKRI